MKLRNAVLIGLLCGNLALGGCAGRRTITGVPAGTPVTAVQSWDQATRTLANIATITTNLRQEVITLNQTTFVNAQGQTGKIFPDGPAYASTLTAIGRIDQLQAQAAQYLAAQPNNWNVSTQAKVKAIISMIGTEVAQLTASGIIGIKNPSKQQQVQALITELSAAANLIISLTS